MIEEVIASAVSDMINAAVDKSYYEDQKEYNSPKAQLSRIKEAGLNPNLIYGAIQPSTVSMPNTKGSNLAQSVIAAKEFSLAKKLNDKQIEEIDANIENTKADTENKRAQNPHYLELARQLKDANDMQELFNDYIKQNPDAYYKPQIERFSAELEHIKNIDDVEKQKLELQRLLNDAQVDKLKSEVELNAKQGKHVEAQTDYVKKQTELISKDIENYVLRFLTNPTPWYAEILKTVVAKHLGLDKDNPSVDEVVASSIDYIKKDTQETKEKAKMTYMSIYNSKYLSHDDEYTYRIVTRGPYKGRTIRVRQSDGKIDFHDFKY